ncbi:predicted protein [Uncinocarpus reesii 1704]|uniref:Structure-specific endonuclease subunit SLX4 n=1 Tax=Uncinocarpus reesii (strain UAMH 1704) TaxID=336963 RepID=SLX4_UNCRE|nr:uncharacterized protein UREG_01755 [Uncinocarpus reesii 1704]C4JJE8.1 RecName: Full=Structure-specific endonuclease subunit SLX4 [Uncinocarpus reesii 1704]EEP76906.1 predicted protein [Uncinocarpus reesii 1704]
MSFLNSSRRRTRSPSPGQIFAPSATPIVIDSSPSVPSASSILDSLLGEFSEARDPYTVEAGPTGRSSDHLFSSPGVLTQSPGRENVPPRPSERTKDAHGKDRFLVSTERNGRSPFRGNPYRSAEIHSPKGRLKAPTKEGGTRKTKKFSSSNRTLTGRSTKFLAKTASKPTQSSKVPSEIPAAKLDSLQWEDGELRLELATTRRGSWTPIKDTSIDIVDPTRNLSPSNVSAAGSQKFSSMLSDYGFTKGSTLTMENELRREVPTTKRRLELLQGTANDIFSEGDFSRPPEKSVVNPNGTHSRRSRKTTSTTITSLSTAQYGHQDSRQMSNLADFFPSGEAVERPSGAIKKLKTSKSGTKKKGVKKAKEAPLFKVASIEDALKSLEDQVCLFGTSSQLERVSSDEEPQMANFNLNAQFPRKNSRPQKTRSPCSNPKTSKSLWYASSRGYDDIEFVDMIDSSNPKTLESVEASTFVTPIDSSPMHSQVASQMVFENPCDVSHVLTKIPQTGPKDPIENPVCPEIQIRHSGNVKTQSTSGQSIPSFRGLTTAQLAQKVASFGFKPLRSREKMISLLEKCWESQQQTHIPAMLPASHTALPDSVTRAEQMSKRDTIKSRDIRASKSRSNSNHIPGLVSSTSQNTGYAAKSPDCIRGSSKSNDIGTTQGSPLLTTQSVIVIPDSDDSDNDNNPTGGAYSYPSLASNTPSSSTRTMASESLLSVRTRYEANVGEEQGSNDINQQITKAIRAQPRLVAINGVKRPTWLEKILMYDPIVLDDLTVWLNTEGLDQIGEDSEVSGTTVREWCESKGICCTWKKKRHVAP